MTQDQILGSLIPGIGVFLSLLIALSTIPAVLQIKRSKSLQSFNPSPLVTGFLSCLSLLLYAVAIEDVYIFSSNLPATFLNIWKISIVLRADDITDKRKDILSIFWLTGGAIAFITNICAMKLFTHERMQLTMAIQNLVFLILFQLSLVENIWQVIRHRNPSMIMTGMACLCAISNAVWCTYGVVKNDPYLYFAQGSGVLINLSQLVVWAILRRQTPLTEKLEEGMEADRTTLESPYPASLRSWHTVQSQSTDHRTYNGNWGPWGYIG